MTSTVRAQEASSSTPPRCTYHVFLSFRGEDTRKTFTDHLYTALNGAGFHTFRDDDEIERGENIDFDLQRAIQESRIFIIVLSKNYASSRWCLDELVRILERKRILGHQVLPVFYDVDPSDVKKQTGNFKKSFLRHERRFKAEAIEEGSHWMEKIEEWREALREIADLAGMDLRNHGGSLTKLQELSFGSCTKLQSLFEVPSVMFLDISHCTSLERVTRKPLASCLSTTMYGSGKLVEFEGAFKLEPIRRVDADIINSLGICNLESMANTEMNFYQFCVSDPTRLTRLPIQGLFEFGVFSTFIPGREVPKGWLSNNSSSGSIRTGCSSSSLSFIVPCCTSIPNDKRRIRCLNVCFVYALSQREQIWFPPPLFKKISNKTKDLKWIYGPRYFPIPVGEEHVMWLSQWKIGNQFRLEVGDEVNVTVVADVGFQVKKCGINLVYVENEGEEETLQQLNSAHPNCQGVCYPEERRIAGAYFASLAYTGYTYSGEERGGPYDWLTWATSSDWAKKLLEDFTVTLDELIEEIIGHSEARWRSIISPGNLGRISGKKSLYSFYLKIFS